VARGKRCERWLVLLRGMEVGRCVEIVRSFLAIVYLLFVFRGCESECWKGKKCEGVLWCWNESGWRWRLSGMRGVGDEGGV